MTDALRSVLGFDAGLPERFERLAVISAQSHLDAPGLVDGRTLVVSTDWLAWDVACRRGIAAVHYEAGLGDWLAPDIHADHYVEAARWGEQNGADVTGFMGVSLARCFTREVGMALHHFRRHRLALLGLCRRFGPRTLALYGCRSDYDYLDAWAQRTLVRDVAAQAGARFEDCLLPPAGAEASTRRMVTNPGPATGRDWLRWAFGVAAEAAFALTRVGRSGPRLLALPSLLMAEVMAEAVPDHIRPVYLSDRLPKRMAFLKRLWRAGVWLAAFPQCELTKTERGFAETLGRRVLDGLGPDPESRFLHHYAQTRLMGEGSWVAMARRIKQWRKLFARHRFHGVLVCDASNYESYIPLLLARESGAVGVELLNGMFTTLSRHETRVGGNGCPPLVSAWLAWGPQQCRWLDETGAAGPKVVTGYPGIQALMRTRAGPAAGRRALVLAHPPSGDDLAACRGDMIAAVGGICRLLRDKGYESLRFKLHPGLECPDYFQRLFRHWGLEVEVIQAGSLHQLVDWADVVVGPTYSGSSVETLALGKPYLAYLVRPSAATLDSCRSMQAATSSEDLARALDAGQDRGPILDSLCAYSTIADPARAVWEAFATFAGGRA